MLDDLQPRRGARGQPLGPQHFVAAHGDPAFGTGRLACAVRCAYSRVRNSGSRKRTCLTRHCAIRMASRSGPPSRAATAVARPCPGMRASERVSRTWRPGCRCRISTCICRWRRRNAIPPLPCTAFAACSSGASRFRLLISGDLEFIAATESVLAFRRFDSSGSLLAAFNLSGEAASIPLPGVKVGRAIGGHGLPEGSFANATLRLPGHGVAFFELIAP